jgi:hypothetical protein
MTCPEQTYSVIRILHYSSFTPFVVIFLHAISAAKLEDVQLLDDVVGTLKQVSGTSKQSERLHQVCATFAAVAREMVKSQRVNITSYSFEDNSLKLPMIPGLWTRECSGRVCQESLELDMSQYVNDWETFDMDGIMAGWVTGESTSLNMAWDQEVL